MTPPAASGPVVTIKHDQLGPMCVFLRIENQRRAGRERYFEWTIYDHIPDEYRPVEFAAITVRGTNGDAPYVIALDPEDPDWYFYHPFDGSGTKVIESYLVYTSDGRVLDLTDSLVQELGDGRIRTGPNEGFTRGTTQSLFANCPA